MHKHIGRYRNHTHGAHHDVWLHFVRDVESLGRHLDSAVACYKEVFAGPPYNENYEGQEKDILEPLFKNYAENGILVLVLAGDSIDTASMIGFAASIGAENSEVTAFLKRNGDRLQAPLGQFLYMAELAVLSDYRKQGLGKILVGCRISEALERHPGRFKYVLMRTAEDGSNSANIYRRLGAKQIPDLIEEKDEFGTQSKRRIFLSMPLD